MKGVPRIPNFQQDAPCGYGCTTCAINKDGGSRLACWICGEMFTKEEADAGEVFVKMTPWPSHDAYVHGVCDQPKVRPPDTYTLTVPT